MIEKHFFALVYTSPTCVTVAPECVDVPKDGSSVIAVSSSRDNRPVDGRRNPRRERTQNTVRTNPNILELLNERLVASMRD